MANHTNAPKTMESNHKVATVLATGLFVFLCAFIAFPLLAGLLAKAMPSLVETPVQTLD